MRVVRSVLLISALAATGTSGVLAQSTPPHFLVEFEGQFGASADKIGGSGQCHAGVGV